MNVAEELDLRLAEATSVRVMAVGRFDARARARSKHDPALVCADAAALIELRAALAIDAASLEERIALMTPGTLDLHFLRGHDLCATVTWIPNEFLRWSGFGFDARLRDPQKLAAWLSARGWS